VTTLVTTDVTDGTSIDAADLNNNLTAIKAVINGNIDNANVASGAAIVPSKLSPGTNGQVIATVSGAPAWAWGAVTMLSDTTLGVDAASVDITSISASFAHLRLLIYARSDVGATFTNLYVRFNGDTGNNYDWQTFAANAASTAASEGIGQGVLQLGYMPANSAVANSFGACEAVIPNYTSTIGHKALTCTTHVRHTNASGGVRLDTTVGDWRGGAAINQITVLGPSGNLKAGTRVTLYGMAA
jgi:hypothetical protein